MNKKPRILIVGSDKIFAIENHYVKYFKERDADVHLFNAPSIFFDYYNASTLNKILFKSGLSSIYRVVNRKFREVVEEVRPDIIWVFKGMEIFPESLKWARKKNILLANYNPDNPFIFSGRGSGNYNVTRCIGLYDFHFTYHMGVAKQIREDYNVPVEILPFGFDGDENLYNSCRLQEETLKVCFLGNPDEHRLSFLRSLADLGVSIDLYGYGWSHYLQHDNIKTFPPVFSDELWKVLYRYRVQLNIMRIHNLDSHNMRSFEVPGIGGIMVAPDTAEHRLYFENEKEVFLFSTVEECASIINRLIAMPREDAEKIRIAARLRSINSGYTYPDRAAFALHHLENLYSTKKQQEPASPVQK
jgi:spore maturation protein CgeB